MFVLKTIKKERCKKGIIESKKKLHITFRMLYLKMLGGVGANV